MHSTNIKEAHISVDVEFKAVLKAEAEKEGRTIREVLRRMYEKYTGKKYEKA